jgi:hypothetical protein
VGLGGIGILPMIHGLEAHATLNRVFINVLRFLNAIAGGKRIANSRSEFRLQAV